MLNQPLQYLWVYQWDHDGRCLAAKWSEAPEWIDAGHCNIDPDLNMGIPVFRRTDHGLAQYCRFEEIASLPSYDRRRNAA